MRVLVTGACGFVGANLIAAMSEIPGYYIRAFDNESMGSREHLGSEFAGDFVKGDIRDAALVASCLDGIDVVVHLAADTRVIDSIADPTFNFDVNVVGTFNILEAMRRLRTKRLVNASTGGAIIGHASGPVDETMVAAPLAPYGASKLAVEGYCNAYSACYDFSAVSLRFSNVFGPRSYHKGSVVAAFYKAVLAGKALTVYGDGTQVRDYVFVGDICKGIIQALEQDVSGPLQLGSGRPTDLNTLIRLMREVTGLAFDVNYEPARAGEIHSTYCNVSRAQAQIGFVPTADLKQCLEETWAWFLAMNRE